MSSFFFNSRFAVLLKATFFRLFPLISVSIASSKESSYTKIRTAVLTLLKKNERRNLLWKRQNSKFLNFRNRSVAKLDPLQCHNQKTESTKNFCEVSRKRFKSGVSPQNCGSVANEKNAITFLPKKSTKGFCEKQQAVAFFFLTKHHQFSNKCFERKKKRKNHH